MEVLSQSDIFTKSYDRISHTRELEIILFQPLLVDEYSEVL